MQHSLLFVLLVFAGTLTAQADTTVAPFVAYWEKGDTYNFSVSKIKNTYQNDSLVKADTSSYRSTFEVLDSSTQGYLIKYTFGQQYQQTTEVDPVIMSALDSFSLDHLLYTTDINGRFQRLVNWEDFARAMKKAIAVAEEQVIASQQLDTAVFRSIMRPIVGAYTSESGILHQLAGELQHLHFFYGYQYVVGDTLRYDDHYANNFGGDAFPVACEVYVENLAWSDNFVVMRALNALKPEATDIFRTTMQQTFGGIGNAGKGADFSQLALNIEDDNWYAFYYNPGIPYRIENDRWTTTSDPASVQVVHERLLVEWVD